jgi:hypothetical protein
MERHFHKLIDHSIVGFELKSIRIQFRRSDPNVVYTLTRKKQISVRSEVSTAVTMKDGVLWDVTPCGVCKNRRYGGT